MDEPHISTRTDAPPQRRPHIRRFYSGGLEGRFRPLGLLILLAIAAAMLFGIYHLFLDGGRVRTDIVDLSQSLQHVQELSTIRSHLRFAVVVRQESGNIIVRRLADQAEQIGMNDISTMLFQDPTMIVELHGVATYGMRMNDLAKKIAQDDSTVRIALPAAEVLDVKLVAADTRLVAQMKGLFRGSNDALLLEAGRQGERFVRDYAGQDTAALSLAALRAREILSFLVERGGKRAVFE